VLDQNYQNYIAIYMDDISIDGTAEAVEQYLNDYDKNNHYSFIFSI
jgi:glycosyltransferase involved in cell wall biosynthesis